MNKISPLDIRVTLLAYPLVTKEDAGPLSNIQRPILPNYGDERIVSLFQNSPKPLRLELSRPKVPLILRKGRQALIYVFESINIFFKKRERSNILTQVAPPRQLLVPSLPYPPFQISRPPRFFWHPDYLVSKDEYTPSCLISEVKEDLPKIVFNSTHICIEADRLSSQKGTLQQDSEGFIYLELPESLITDLFSLIQDNQSEAISLNQLEPSPAHIPVVLPHEWMQRKGYGEIKELGNDFSFEITHFYSLHPKRWPGVEKVYFINIRSPELENFRERYSLPSRILGHDFLVTIAYVKAADSASKKEIFRLNVSCFAA